MLIEFKSGIRVICKHYNIFIRPSYKSVFDTIGSFDIITILSDSTKHYVDQSTLQRLVENLSSGKMNFSDIHSELGSISIDNITIDEARKYDSFFSVTKVDNYHAISRAFERRELSYNNVKLVPTKININKAKNKRIIKLNGLLSTPFNVMSLDFEMFERDQSKVLEIGYTIFNSQTHDIVDIQHIIIQDHLKYKNKEYVPDNRDKFQYGTSVTTDIKTAFQFLKQALEKCHVLLTHGGKGSDINIMEQHIPGVIDNKVTINTDEMVNLVTGTKKQFKLCNLAATYGITEQVAYHNAGNDAVITMKCYFKMIEYIAVNSTRKVV